MNLPEEKALIQALANGDIKAFDKLYYTYHKKLYAFSLRFLKNQSEVEDLVQKVFTLIWEKRKNINPDKSFNNYLFTIARNDIFDLLKKKAFTEYYNDQILVDIEQTEDDIEIKKLVELIYSLIENIPERRRQIFLMNRDMGMTYKQIAEKLGISENTVDTQIRHSLNYLRNELPKHIKSLPLLFYFFLTINGLTKYL
ncbi:MAG: RNA polymerase sigma-70 factor [Prolixibacteraceae bacterium]|jgi:RNA polymerase sigma-70 factor (ECF subfamily)|nr:RNA polymerase sigma-70 factor [Prolixibacteraceae bacterium]